jgi:hypothetical protein
MNIFKNNDSDSSESIESGDSMNNNYNKELYDEFEQYISDDKQKYKSKDYFITVNSKDRNYTIDTPYDFSINFSSYNTNVMKIGKSFKNIKSIQFMGMVIPNIYLDIKEVLSLYNQEFITASANTKKFMRVSDLPYLMLNISEIRNPNMFGTNTQLNKASFILVLYDILSKTNNNSGSSTVSGSTFTESGNLNNSIIGGTDRRVLLFKDMTLLPIEYTASPNTYLNNLDISITTPEGKVLSNLNNCLECSTIFGTSGTNNATAVTPTKITVEFKQYLCGDEYNIGDKITFKDVTFTSANSDLTNFLMRDEGHTIIELPSTGKGSGTTKLYKQIVIPFEYTIDLDVSSNTGGVSVVKNYLNMKSSSAVTFTFSTGKMFNLSLQTLFSLKITNEEQII